MGLSSVELLRRACDLGSGIACNDLAVVAEHNHEAAVALLEKSCDLGLARGCANLALYLADDTNNAHRVENLLRSSCEKSDGFACARLGDWIFQQQDDELHHRDAFRAYDKGCSLNNVDACTSSAFLALSGKGTKRDSGLARSRFEAGCVHNFPMACFGLGVSLIDDSPNEQERERAVALFASACKSDIALACHYYGLQLLQSNGSISAEARAAFNRACELGATKSCEAAQELNAQSQEVETELDD